LELGGGITTTTTTTATTTRATETMIISLLVLQSNDTEDTKETEKNISRQGDQIGRNFAKTWLGDFLGDF
jgi:hypothetical protein